MKMNKFFYDIKRGEVGEEIVKSFLYDSNNILYVIDVRNNEYYKELDIDFITIDKQYNKFFIEVKTDSMFDRTNNFPYEYYSNSIIKSQGCMEKTKSNLIFFISDITYDCYIIDTESLQNFVHSQIQYDKHILMEHRMLKLIPMGDQAKGFLIPLYRFKDYNIKYEMVNLREYILEE